MQAGDVIDDRFEIERLARSGGMGCIYRACDQRTGEAVALKVLQSAGPQQLRYFAEEVRALAMARVPGVVRYIAHGVTAAGQPYLTMEWLSGETLAERLAREGLTVAESVAVVERVAATLGGIHRLGIVHRDLKPTNLLLVDGQLERVTLLDFGIARIAGVSQPLTLPGTLVGTPEYMAPEQVRGDDVIDARADVFALGAVFFKCLTGRTPFQGKGALDVLAKVLLEAPPSLRELRADIPEAIESLVERALSKSPEGRPRDGAAVAAELAALPAPVVVGRRVLAPVLRARATELTTTERKVMCLVLARDRAAQEDATRSVAEEVGHARALRAIAQRYHGQIQLVEASSPLIVLTSAVAPTDLAARSARCALEIQALLGGAPVVLVTGRAEIAERLPVGELVDRALQMLPAERASVPSVSVRIDEVTAGLLGTRFETTQDDEGRYLLPSARDEQMTTPSLLLGKLTACVGRSLEMVRLLAAFDQCVSAKAASAVLVTATAGMGKSRLRQELVQRLLSRGEALEIWIGQGDPMRAGSAFDLLAHALRRAFGLVDGEPLDVRRRKVVARVERHAGLSVPRVAAFIGELVGAPFPDEADVQLHAARRSPILMGVELRLAWEDLLRAECAKRPVLLILEDLHWGDRPTVTMIDAALRHLRDLPLMVLALGRPEVHELFPKLWEGCSVHELRLGPLPREASEQLVREVLGESVSAEQVATLVERADGNAFFLEEQIRSHASGTSGGMPETVLAMVQARLSALDPEARRVLRAASIFGQAFCESAVSALIGGLQVAPLLADLVEREVIVRRGERRLHGEVEYRFRHALVREAAHGMLTERDLRLGHALAGEWLEAQREADPMALAEHFERGGAPARAAMSYLRAAEQALCGNDLGAAIERAERAIACGASPSTAGALRLVQAEAHLWRGDFAMAEQRGGEAIELLDAGSAAWFSAFTQRVYAACRLGGFDRVEGWMGTVGDAAPLEGAWRARNTCLCAGATALAIGGRVAAADALIGAVERAASDPPALDIEVVANLHQARTFRAMALGDPGGCLAGLEGSLAAFEQAGDRRNACMTRANLGYYYGELGDYSGAEAMLRSALADADRMGLHDVAASAQASLGQVLAYLGQIVEARVLEEEAIVAIQRLGDPRIEVAARSYLAKIALLTGDLEVAEREARAAAEILESAPLLRIAAVAVRARALLGLGRTAEALSAAREAFSTLESIGALEEGESLVRVVYAEALAASGSRPEAIAAIASARDNLLARAAKISDQVLHERFLHGVPDNARTLDLARRWLGEGLL